MHKYNLIHDHKKSMAFPELIVIKLINAHQHYIQTSYKKFHPNWAKNAEVWTEIHSHSYIKHGFPCANFYEINDHSVNVFRHPLDIILSKLEKNMENSHILFTHLSKVWISLHQFSPNSLLLDDIMFSSIPHWSRKIASAAKKESCLWVQHHCHWANFHKTEVFSTTFCKDFMKSSRHFSLQILDHRQTDGQTYMVYT
jgi:hypothetical protein